MLGDTCMFSQEIKKPEPWEEIMELDRRTAVTVGLAAASTLMLGTAANATAGLAKLMAIYKTPKDVAAFDQYYVSTHAPLAKKIPGLRS